MESFQIDSSKVVGNVAILLDNLPASWLELEALEIQSISSDRKKITGTTRHGWNDPSQGLLFESTEITVLVSDDTGEIELVEIIAKQTLLPNLVVNWKATNGDTLLFTASELKGDPLTLEKAEQLPFLSDINALSQLGDFNNFSYQIHLTGFTSLNVYHIWTSRSDRELKFGDVFSINTFTLRGTVVSSVDPNGKPTNWQEITLASDFNLFDSSFELMLRWVNDSNHRVTLTPKEGENFAELSHVLGLFGNHTITEAIDDLNKELPLLDDIRIQRVTADFNKDSLKMERVAILGDLSALDADFEVRFVYFSNGHLTLTIRLRIGSFFSVSDLLGTFTAGTFQLPVNAQVADLVFNGTLNPLGYSLSINIIENWEFSLGATPLVLRSTQLIIAKENQQNFRFQFSGQLQIGKVDVELIAIRYETSSESSWLLETEIAQATSIKLADLITDVGQLFHFNVPDHIPDLEVHNIGVSFDTGSHDFSLQLGVTLEKPGLGPFSEGDVFVEINLTKNANGSHDFAMNLSGFITVAGTEFDASAQHIGQKDWAIDLVWDKQDTEGIDLTKIMQIFEGEEFQPHDDFHKLNKDLLIEHVEFHYQHGDETTSTDTSFLMDLKVRLGANEFEGFLSGVKIDDQWHFIFGVGYNHLDSIPGHLFDSKKMSDFTVKNVWVIVNTSNEASGNWPPLPASIPSTVSQQATKSGLVLLAEMDISQQKAVPGASDVFAGHENTDVVVLAEIGTTGLQLEGILEGKLQIPTGQGHHITMDEVSLTVNLGTNNSLRLAGTFDLDIDDHRQHLTVSLDVSAEGIVITADDKIDNSGRKANTKGWQPFGLKGMNIDELAFELGIDFIPPGVRIGFEGKMHLEGEKPGDDMLAIVLEFSEPIPNPEYLAIAFDTIKFSQIANLFPGSSSDGHQHISDNLLEIHKFGLIWCEKPIVLPDGTNGRVGFSLHGAVKIMNWGAYFSLEVHPETGIQGTGELAPIHLGPLRIFGKGKGVGIKQELVGGEWRDVSNVVVNADQKGTKSLQTNETRMYELVAPGGVSIQFNSVTSPYLRMSADVQLFGMDLLDIDIDIEKDRAIFDLFFQIPLIAKFKVASFLTKEHDFGFDGNFFLGLDININIPFVFGPIHVHIRIGFDVEMKIRKTGEHMDLELKGSFMIMGREITLGDLKIEGIPTSLKELPKWILDRIEGKPVPHFSNKMVDGSGANNQDEFSRKREELANQLLQKAQSWANFVHADILRLKEEELQGSEAIGELVTKIRQDITTIQKEGNGHVSALKDTGTTEEAHLKALANLATTKVEKDSNKWRAAEMNRMQWEIRWLKDESNELREKLQGLWEQFSGDVKEITVHANKLTTDDPSSKGGYPQRAVDHHLNILTINQQAHGVEHEVLQRGRTHAQAILNQVTQDRFFPLTKLK